MRVRGYPAGVPCWAAVSTVEPADSAKFYGALFGWDITDSSVDGYSMFYLGDRAVAGMRERGPAGWLPYIATDDLSATVGAVLENGGSVLDGPAELSDAAQTAVLGDPTGAPLGLWQRRRLAGAQVLNELGSVCWADLATGDPGGATAFYGKVFGWAGQAVSTASGTPYTEWYRDDRYVAGMFDTGARAAAAAAPHWTVNVLVDDCARVVAQACGLGGRALLPPTDVGAGMYAQLTDPHGAEFRVTQLHPELLASL
jgi:predicted enzyme related to lactoylglutathione lyase